LLKEDIKTNILSTTQILALMLPKNNKEEDKKKKKIQMPAAARAGIGLLIMGALLVGVGQYLEKGALSLYGIIIVTSGFVLYMASSIVAKRRGSI
jgi:hypothetical protein